MRRLTLVRSTAVAAAAIATLLTGCGAQAGNQAGGAGSPSSGPPSTGSPSTGSPSATAAPPTLTTSASPAPSGSSEPVGTPSGPPLELDGVAARGVEPGCLVFTTGGRHYLLVGTTGTVPTEVPIRVRGVVLTGVFSYCQQGTPLKVLEISRR
jgi:hypothetical protein